MRRWVHDSNACWCCSEAPTVRCCCSSRVCCCSVVLVRTLRHCSVPNVKPLYRSVGRWPVAAAGQGISQRLPHHVAKITHRSRGSTQFIAVICVIQLTSTRHAAHEARATKSGALVIRHFNPGPSWACFPSCAFLVSQRVQAQPRIHNSRRFRLQMHMTV